MIWPFSSKNEKKSGCTMKFTGPAFIEYQCKYGQTTITPHQGIVALMLDASKEFGISVPVKVESDGRQMAALRVASQDGGFIVASFTPTGKGDRLKPDDVVIWVPMNYSKDTFENAGDVDPRFGWLGVITAKVLPEIRSDRKDLVLICRYDR